MKTLFCWRCRMEVPMLDDVEFAAVSKIYTEAFRATKEYRVQHDLSLDALSMEERLSPVCRAYNKMTGFNETNAAAIMHHRFSLYGPICPTCGKPFRSPQASFCAACGCRAEVDS